MSRLRYIDLLFRMILVPLNSFNVHVNSEEDNLIIELRNRVRQVTLPYKPSGVHDQWFGNIEKLKEKILSRDPKNFLQWDVIRATMFIGNALFTLREFFYLRQSNWNKWKKAIKIKNFLPTEPYLLYPKSNGNLIHHAYHIAKFEKMSGKKIKDFDFIFEYGGGYGGMCQLIFNLGFKGKYIIYDLPLLSALQTFYLKMNKLNGGKILCLDKLKDVKQLIPSTRTLFIGTWSLSESPSQIRKELYPLIKRVDAFLIGYQGRFGGVDNQKYFKGLVDSLPKLNWRNEEIRHLKNNYYLFGFKKRGRNE